MFMHESETALAALLTRTSDIMAGAAQHGGFINVTVTEPVMHNDTLGSYVTYKINTVTDRSDFPYGQVRTG
jgi:hypothetical protein